MAVVNSWSANTDFDLGGRMRRATAIGALVISAAPGGGGAAAQSFNPLMGCSGEAVMAVDATKHAHGCYQNDDERQRDERRVAANSGASARALPDLKSGHFMI